MAKKPEDKPAVEPIEVPAVVKTPEWPKPENVDGKTRLLRFRCSGGFVAMEGFATDAVDAKARYRLASNCKGNISVERV